MLERLLIVGYGSIGSRHARIAKKLLPGAEMGVLRHRSCDGFADAGIDRCFTSLDDAIAFAPQAAVISNPASRHVEVAIPLARAGAHLLIEKPISTSIEKIEDLLKECETRGLTLMVGYNLRFLPSLRKFRDFLAQGMAGRVLSVRSEIGQYLPAWRPGTDYRLAVSAKAELGGGVLLELSHEIDYLRWIFGEADWVSAVLRRQSRLEIDVEDTAIVALGFSAGKGQTPVVASLNMDFLRHDTTRKCTVVGEAGSLSWDAVAGKIEFVGQGEAGSRPLFSGEAHRDDSYVAEWQRFLHCIQSGEPAEPSGRDGLAVMNIIEACRLSSSRGSVVRLRQGSIEPRAREVSP